MKEIALHLLDIVQNSVRAGASHVDIRFLLGADGVLEMGVKDDGCGMSADLLARVRSPFTTTRTTRKVGLGIPLLMQNAMQTGGRVDIESEEGKGTDIVAFFNTKSIDCLPLGDLASTMASIIMGSPDKPAPEAWYSNSSACSIRPPSVESVTRRCSFAKVTNCSSPCAAWANVP